MGQYHWSVNLDKKQYLDPHKLGMGLKLWEQGANRYGTPVAVMMLLACSNGRGGGDFEENPLIGSWAGDRVVWIGDYAEPDDLKHIGVNAEQVIKKALRDGSDEYEDISDLVLPLLCKEFDLYVADGEGWRSILEREDYVKFLEEQLIKEKDAGKLVRMKATLEKLREKK